MLPGERAGDTEKFNSTATGYATQFGENKGEFKEPGPIARTAAINPNPYPQGPWEFHAGPDSGKRGARDVRHPRRYFSRLRLPNAVSAFYFKVASPAQATRL